MYGHKNCSFNPYYGEALKLDYFGAATFKTILGGDYRSTFRTGASHIKTLINMTKLKGCTIER